MILEIKEFAKFKKEIYARLHTVETENAQLKGEIKVTYLRESTHSSLPTHTPLPNNMSKIETQAGCAGTYP
jgi:hypothetical protein